MQRFVWIIACATLLAGGCARSGRRTDLRDARAGAHTIITPDGIVVGRVASVFSSGRFVVLSFPMGRVPPADHHYSLYRKGLKVAEVRIGKPQTAENMVADIMTGEAQLNDEARPQ